MATVELIDFSEVLGLYHTHFSGVQWSWERTECTSLSMNT